MIVRGVRLSRDAFFGLLISAVDPFKRECTGILFGKTPVCHCPFYSISFVHGNEHAHRWFDAALPYDRADKRIYGLCQAMPGTFSKIVGRFHSHPEYGKKRFHSVATEGDAEHMHAYKIGLEIVVQISLRMDDKSGRWWMRSDGGIQGSLGKYNFSLAAYVFDTPDAEKPKRVPIIAPKVLHKLNCAWWQKHPSKLRRVKSQTAP